jgi:hypothetical protein
MKALFLPLLACLSATAQTTLPTIKVSDERVPPGGMAQMKVLLTSPKPITTGNMDLDLSGVFFDSVDGIALFNAAGDVVGAATMENAQVNAHFTSPQGTFGATVDYPILTVALRVSQFVVPGQVFTVSLNPNASFWKDLLGQSIAFELKPGSITIGGSVNITNVLPGGGAIPAGGSFTIQGMNFSKDTKVVVKGPRVTSLQYVSATEIRAFLKDGGVLDGAEIQVQNPDKSSDSYFSYMRGVPVGVSARSLLNQTVPVFSILTATEAILPSTVSPLNSDYWTGLALQNPSAVAASLTLELRDGTGAVIASTVLALPTGCRISREISELFGVAVPAGGTIRIVSDRPVQALGLLGQESTQVVTPIAVTIVAGTPVTGSVDGVSNKPSGGGGSGSGKTP